MHACKVMCGWDFGILVRSAPLRATVGAILYAVVWARIIVERAF